MAAIDFRPSATKSGFSVVKLFAAIAAWNDTRKTRDALNKLSSRELYDIGLMRGDIEDIAHGNLIR